MPIVIRVRELREAKGWTQGQLAERAGVSRATVNRFESDHPPASMDLGILENLCGALGTTPGGLLLLEGHKRKR